MIVTWERRDTRGTQPGCFSCRQRTLSPALARKLRRAVQCAGTSRRSSFSARLNFFGNARLPASEAPATCNLPPPPAQKFDFAEKSRTSLLIFHHELRLHHRQPQMHRLPRLFHRLQGGERSAAGRQPHLGQVRGNRHLPRCQSPFPGDALQPLRQPALRANLPGDGDVPADRRHRRIRSVALHRLQGVPAGLPLRRDLHRPGQRHGRQVPLLLAPHRDRAGAGLRGGLPGTRHHRRRHGQPIQRDQPAAGDPGCDGAQAGARHGAQAVLHRRQRRGAAPDGDRARAAELHVGGCDTVACC